MGMTINEMTWIPLGFHLDSPKHHCVNRRLEALEDTSVPSFTDRKSSAMLGGPGRLPLGGAWQCLSGRDQVKASTAFHGLRLPL